MHRQFCICDIDNNMYANFNQDRPIELFEIFDIQNFPILQSQFHCHVITSEKKLVSSC